MTLKHFLIAAATSKGIIGVNNRMPWRSAKEYKQMLDILSGRHYWSITDNKMMHSNDEEPATLIMGRKTFESMKVKSSKFYNCDMIVLSENANFKTPYADIARNLDDALSRVLTSNVFYFGGHRIYKESMDRILPAIMYVSRMKKDVVLKENDQVAYMPPIDLNHYEHIATPVTNDEFDLEIYSWRFELAYALHRESSNKKHRKN